MYKISSLSLVYSRCLKSILKYMFLVIGLINNNGDEIWLTLVELIEEASETANRLPFSWFSSFKNAQNNSFWKFPGEKEF